MNHSTQAACELTHPAQLLARLRRLEEPVRQAAHRAYTLFASNPDHASLRFKKLAGYGDVWSVRINEQYRAVGERKGDTIVWAWIGSHNEFDNLFG
jgi:plasmid maintenance system killer protein